MIIDSMSKQKETVYSDHDGIGYVDLGIGVANSKKAGEDLVFLVNGLRTKWCYPIGYFFVGKLE